MFRIAPISVGLLSLLLLMGVAGFGCGGESCKGSGDCPKGSTCQLVQEAGKPAIRLCVKEILKGAVGSTCLSEDECKSNFCLKPVGDPARYCSTICEQTSECPAGFQCDAIGPDVKACIREKGTITPPGQGCQCGKEKASCAKNGHSDCDTKAGYFCLSQGPTDTKAVCVKPCKQGVKPGSPDEGACPEGFICSATATGINICVEPQFTPKDMGGSCGLGGKAECKEEFFCYSRWANDSDAFCSKYCNPYREGDCGLKSVCESPREEDPWLCIPKGTKELGEDCSARSFLECKSAVCARETQQSDKYFCTQSCDPDIDNCPPGWGCKLFGHLYRYLCSKAGGGEIGSLCTKNGAATCKSGICISPGANSINKICSQACDGTTSCPGGFVCDEQNKYCIPQTGKGKIGDPCVSPQDCIFGTCTSDSQGKQFCTQQCTDNAQCPSGFECRHLEFNQKYCLPQQAGTNKLGEPCPNGPGDCETRNCLSDPINAKTFCTQPCDDQRICPDPYVCTKLNDREAYCTPKGYQPP